MSKWIPLLLLFAGKLTAQDLPPGRHIETVMNDGFQKVKTLTYAVRNVDNSFSYKVDFSSNQSLFGSSNVRWSYTEPAAIAYHTSVSSDGRYNAAGWSLNNHRISLYKNENSTPVWEYITPNAVYDNYVSISDTGGVIAAGSYRNILMFNNTSANPIFNFDLTQLPDTGLATHVSLTRGGSFLVATASRSDSSTVFGFNSGSTVPVWTYRIVPSILTGGGTVQGLKLSGNDSVIIVNTYAEFFILNTFTGQLIFRGVINPSSPSSGTQATQGIDHDGSVIATINYSGIIRVYERSGSTYNFIWQNQEPPGQFFNWYTCVDITSDGEFIAAGTLNFLSSSSYDGKIKLFKKSGNGTPDWTYAGCGDEVSDLSFSASGNILTAASWGDFNGLTEDLYVFKTFLGGTPIFKVNTSGSFFTCSISGDGRTAVAGGKAVHARQFGSGGLLYNIDIDTTEIPTSISENYNASPEGFSLRQNYPNPFNPVTTLPFTLGVSSQVSVLIHNSAGKLVHRADFGKLNAGLHNYVWNASGMPSGVYFYTLKRPGDQITKSMLLIK